MTSDWTSQEIYFDGMGNQVQNDFLYVGQPVSKINDTSAGMKFDGGKVRYDLLDPAALEGMATVLTYGANKYGDRNWEKGIKWSRVFGALLRHAWAMWRGEDLDPETNLPHIDHCAVNVMFLQRYFRTHRLGWDDRPSSGLMNQKEQVLKALGGGVSIGGGSAGSVAGKLPGVSSLAKGNTPLNPPTTAPSAMSGSGGGASSSHAAQIKNECTCAVCQPWNYTNTNGGQLVEGGSSPNPSPVTVNW